MGRERIPHPKRLYMYVLSILSPTDNHALTLLKVTLIWLIQNYHILTYRFIPESFRWYYAHDRIADAEAVVATVSKVNRRPLPDMAYMKELVMADPSEKKDQKYSFVDLFKTAYLRKITLLLSINW